MFNIDLNKIPVNKGFTIGLLIAASFFPPFFFLRVVFPSEFIRHGNLILILLALAIGFVTQSIYCTMIMVVGSAKKIYDGTVWFRACIGSSVMVVFTFATPIFIQILLKVNEQLLAIRVMLLIAAVQACGFSLGVISRRKSKKKELPPEDQN